MNTVADRLRHLRTQAGLTQREAALRSGVGNDSWVRWEGADTNPNLKTLQGIQVGLKLDNATLGWLVSGVKE